MRRFDVALTVTVRWAGGSTSIQTKRPEAERTGGANPGAVTIMSSKASRPVTGSTSSSANMTRRLTSSGVCRPRAVLAISGRLQDAAGVRLVVDHRRPDDRRLARIDPHRRRPEGDRAAAILVREQPPDARSSVVIGMSDSHTAAWKASGTTSEDA